MHTINITIIITIITILIRLSQPSILCCCDDLNDTYDILLRLVLLRLLLINCCLIPCLLKFP